MILGLLLTGQVAVEGLLGGTRLIQGVLWQVGAVYPRYEAAFWLSVLAPFHPTPQQVMGLELADVYRMTGGRDAGMRDAALERMEASWQRAPCYLPTANDALALISGDTMTPALLARIDTLVARTLDCNPRHGLSYYHAGLGALQAGKADAAQAWWRAGLAASGHLGERLMLATAILSRTLPRHQRELAHLASQMAAAIHGMEATSEHHPQRAFWNEAKLKLRQLAGEQFLVLVPEAGKR